MTTKTITTLLTALLTTATSMQAQTFERRGRIENVTDYTQLAHQAKSRRIGTRASAPLPAQGSPRVPVILAQFSDKKFTVADNDEAVHQLYEGFFNAGEGVRPGAANSTSYSSVREYYRQMSSGAFTPEFTVIGPVTLSKGYAFYGKDNNGGKDVNISAFYSEACKLALQEAGMDWTPFDSNKDGIVDLVFFIYAGEGQNGYDDDDTIWPKESTSQLSVSYDGSAVTFTAYACTNELFKGKQDGIGTCIHELGHGLGLPDFYDTTNSSNPAYGLDFWDIMDSGCYQINGKMPCFMSAYELDFMGWRKLVELNPDSAYTLRIEPLERGGVAYKVVNKANANEYFILENRQNISYDTYLGWPTSTPYKEYGANHGLMITHVDYLGSAWTGNNVNNNKNHQRITIVPADGTTMSYSILETEEQGVAWAKSNHRDLYPSIDMVTEMSSYAVFNGTTLGQTIDNIRESDDGIITLNINGGDPLGIATTPTSRGKAIKAIFSPAGLPLDALQPGINIVVYGDGTRRKVMK